jgi:hypothetical protein
LFCTEGKARIKYRELHAKTYFSGNTPVNYSSKPGNTEKGFLSPGIMKVFQTFAINPAQDNLLNNLLFDSNIKPNCN